MKKEVIVIGGGIIGLSTAYFLNKAGKKVTVIDENDITNSTSFGNAGLLSAFDEAPLSHPGIVANTMKLMIKGESPAKIHPTLNPKILKWLYKFVQNANPVRVKKTMMLFERMGEIAYSHYEYMQNELGIDLDYHRDGMLFVCTQQETFDKILSNYKEPNPERFEILDIKLSPIIIG